MWFIRANLWSFEWHTFLCILRYFCWLTHNCICDEYASTYTLFIWLHFVCMNSQKHYVELPIDELIISYKSIISNNTYRISNFMKTVINKVLLFRIKMTSMEYARKILGLIKQYLWNWNNKTKLLWKYILLKRVRARIALHYAKPIFQLLQLDFIKRSNIQRSNTY